MVPGAVRIFPLMTQPLLSLGLKSILANQPNFNWVDIAEEDPFQEFLTHPGDETIDILLTDRTDDLEHRPDWLAQLRRLDPSLKILVFLSTLPRNEDVLKAMRVGANGYLLQTATEQIVLHAIETILEGGSYLQPQVTPIVLAELRKPHRVLIPDSTGIELSERELMLIQLAADGLSNIQIADVLGLREKTVRNLWSSLFERLGMNDRTQAVLWAIRTGHAKLR